MGTFGSIFNPDGRILHSSLYGKCDGLILACPNHSFFSFDFSQKSRLVTKFLSNIVSYSFMQRDLVYVGGIALGTSSIFGHSAGGSSKLLYYVLQYKLVFSNVCAKLSSY